MKKISRKNLLFLTFSFSVLISGAIAIPLGIQARSKTFDAELQSYNEKLEGAINLSNQQNFDQNEFVRIAKNLKIKNEFVSKFSVKDAIDLHFDKFYSFDLNDIVDFSPILAKFPDFKVKLVLPSKKEQVKIEGNSLKNLAINIVNTQKSVNFSTQIDLKFDSSAKKIDIKPENLKLIFKLSNNELTKNKSAVELAIALQKNFSENFRKNKDQVKALFKTLHNFGGISVFREGKDQIILPSNFEIKPKLENERLIFSNVDNVQPKLELLLSLFDKNTMKERDFLLEFTNFSKISDVKYGKIEEIFKKNYTFKTDLARVLTFFNLTPSQAIIENLPEKIKNHPDFKTKDVTNFNFWYQKNNSNSFLQEIKKFVPENFNVENVKIEIENKKFNKNELKNFQENHQIPLVVSVFGKFKEESLIPVGIKFGDKNQFNYKLNFLDNLSDLVYSVSLENALNPLDESGKINKNVLNLENFKFEVKENLPTAIFASTFDEAISEWEGKPLDLRNIGKTLKPLFDLLNSSVKLEGKQEPLTKKVNVSATLFADEKENKNIKKNSKKPGDILKETLERIAKIPLLQNRSVFLSSEYSDKYNLILHIKNGNISEKTLKFPIDSVLENNKPFELLQNKTNLHLFLDWRTNVKTTSKTQGIIPSSRNYVDYISALNDLTLKFVPGKADQEQREKGADTNDVPTIYPFKSEANKGIYLTAKGLELERIPDTRKVKDVKNITIFYVFKPNDVFYPPWVNFSLLKSTKNSNGGAKPSKNENILELLIRNYFVPGFNLLGADFRKNSDEQQAILDENGHGSLTKTTFNGELNIKLVPENDQLNLQVQNIIPKNQVVSNQDFLNNTDATVMLKLKIEDEKEGGKSKARLSFYTVESKTPYDPVWEIEEKNIDFSGFNLNNDLKLGVLPIKNDNTPYRGAIILKSLAIFENSKTVSDNKIAKSFIDEYFDLENKTK